MKSIAGMISIAVLLVLAGGWSTGLRASPQEKKDEGNGPQDAGPKGPPPTEREQRILALFTATQKSFKDGKLALVYDFSTENQDLTADWLPALADTRKHIRWPTAYEGTWSSTVDQGIIVAGGG